MLGGGALIKHRWETLGGEGGTDKAQVGNVGGKAQVGNVGGEGGTDKAQVGNIGEGALIKHRWVMLGRGGH